MDWVVDSSCVASPNARHRISSFCLRRGLHRAGSLDRLGGDFGVFNFDIRRKIR
jgi:hypothetical protein